MIKKLYNAYVKAVNDLEKELDRLKNAGDACNCEDVDETYIRRHRGAWDEYHEICVKCGGFIENTEIL